MPVVDALCRSAETVRPGPGPLRGAPAEEVRVVLSWLERPGTRLVRTEQPWSEPAGGAGRWRAWVRRAEEGRSVHAGADRP